MKVTLRPFRSDDVDRFVAEFQDEDGVGPLQWYGYRQRQPDLRREFEGTGLLTSDAGRLVIEADGEWAGDVGWRRNHWGPAAESWCWQLGILVWSEMRGRGVGSEAQRMVAAYLFAHTRAHRVEAVTDVENVAEQRSLENAGFAREGLIRAAQWRGGQWHDQVLYSRLRDDPS